LEIRLAASQLPKIKPYSLKADIEYSEQEGSKRQLDAKNGLIAYRYNRTKAIAIILGAAVTF
jgi:hypothetical protein